MSPCVAPSPLTLAGPLQAGATPSPPCSPSRKPPSQCQRHPFPTCPPLSCCLLGLCRLPPLSFFVPAPSKRGPLRLLSPSGPPPGYLHLAAPPLPRKRNLLFPPFPFPPRPAPLPSPLIPHLATRRCPPPLYHLRPAGPSPFPAAKRLQPPASSLAAVPSVSVPVSYSTILPSTRTRFFADPLLSPHSLSVML